MKPIYRYSWEHSQWALYVGTSWFQRLYILPSNPEDLFELPEGNGPCYRHWGMPPKLTSFLVDESASQRIH